MRRAAFSVLLTILLVGELATASPRDPLAGETGLDLDLIDVVKLTVGATEVTVTFVFIHERTFQSKISPRLVELLTPYVGRNALYVNVSVESVLPMLPFDPTSLIVEQDGVPLLPVDAWVEITHGFLSGRLEVNPMGAERGSGSEGVVVLGDQIDLVSPFRLHLHGEQATFFIGQSSTSASPESGGDEPIAGLPLDTLGGTHEKLLLGGVLSEEGIAEAFGLSPLKVRLMELAPRGAGELHLIMIRLDPDLIDSDLSPALLEALSDMLVPGGSMVWAVSPSGAEFSAWSFYVRQASTHYAFYSTTSFLELTPGFLRAERVEPGQVLAGAIRFTLIERSGFDPNAPFTLLYAGSAVEYP
jgi:hypothetical protein